MKSGLICTILKNADGSDCTNGGASANATRALLVLEGGGPFTEEWAKKAGAPIFKLVERSVSFWSGDTRAPYLHAEPLEAPGEGYAGWMFGGNFLTTSDTRFPNRYPIAIHDRRERF